MERSNLMFDWIISDTHFWHDNIVKFCFRPGYHEEDYVLHNRIMFDNWLKLVGEDEEILHLGDIAFFSRDKTTRNEQVQTISELPGIKKAILGNHDREKRSVYEACGFTVIKDLIIQVKGWEVVFTHYPIRGEDLRDDQINVHGHCHNNSVDGLTKRHKNVSVELMSFSPQRIDDILTGCLYRAGESVDRDFNPK